MSVKARRKRFFASLGRQFVYGSVLVLFVVVIVVVTQSVYHSMQIYDRSTERPHSLDQVDKTDATRLSLSFGLGNASEEHLIKMQEAVLKDVEASNAETKAQVDMAILVCGLIGSVVSFFMVFFGYNTVKEASDAKDRSQEVLTKLNRELEKAEKIRGEIERMVLQEIRPKLASITNYGLKVAEFAGDSFGTMSHSDRIRNCDEALKQLDQAALGSKGHMARSFILARKGWALLVSDDSNLHHAIELLMEACEINVHRKPDRPYNLACAYSKQSKTSGKKKHVDDALRLLRECMEMADANAASDSTISRGYFVEKLRKDDQLDPIRANPDFQKIIDEYSKQQ